MVDPTKKQEETIRLHEELHRKFHERRASRRGMRISVYEFRGRTYRTRAELDAAVDAAIEAALYQEKA